MARPWCEHLTAKRVAIFDPRGLPSLSLAAMIRQSSYSMIPTRYGLGFLIPGGLSGLKRADECEIAVN